MGIPGEESNLFNRLHVEDSNLHQDRYQKQLEALEADKQRILYEQHGKYIEELLHTSATRNVNIPQVSIPNSGAFRASFLEEQLKPLTEDFHTVASLMAGIDKVGKSFSQLGVVDHLHFELHQAPSSNPYDRSADVFPVIHLQPVKKFFAKTGTSIGNGEGDSYITLQYKNMFGGAENLVVDASTGTRTRAAYLVNFNMPVMNRANVKFENLVQVNSQKTEVAGYETVLRGTSQKMFFAHPLCELLQHEVSVENYWRTIRNVTSLSEQVMAQLGDDLRSSVVYACKLDTRDDPHLPTKGTYWRWGTEYSGLFPSVNKYRFVKTATEFQTGYRINPFVSATLTGKLGLLVPLGQTTSCILDRFYIGGANDVRGFNVLGLGPKQNQTAVGGDMFLSGGLSVFSHIPRTAMDSNFKFQHFLNWGKAVPLDKSSSWQQNVRAFATPSVSAGVGLVFNHPMARFEANFVVPLQVSRGDSVRKGFQFGIGMSYM
ncbi:hypothetical protein BABINDRAFT_11659 [Babjeviella inositovora NRRL Y-12698]|uniref:Bacterial surface antigen (D15) domain-containing protein n=1 Tax=Babjeviella inositovora NRRL Y-12698 TaxID=984486 RepID=A0A1E3QV40_9ASCO|nr:uncharacterized protein BABINDRAFT_11659 [Babjeviella inositovora NRRL Y-12698]ODQ81529.1 hypothetical protein BABINDRAFT_11659 [Babjeviella inositovora NRRL Y-12698]